MEITQAALVARMKAEILEDIASGLHPADIDNFGDLHDRCDANEYGGFCEDEVFDAIEEALGEDGRMALFCDCQDEVDAWLAAGRPA